MRRSIDSRRADGSSGGSATRRTKTTAARWNRLLPETRRTSGGCSPKERWEQVTNAVAALPDRQRLVFTLCHLDERTPAEISAATGMSQATVRVHLFRALRKLRGVLGGKA